MLMRFVLLEKTPAMSTRLRSIPKIDILANRKDYYSKNMNLISIYGMRFL